jgi:hypothetical protein
MSATAADWGDFGGHCLIGAFSPAPELLLPTSTVFGIPKAASYLYGTWRDADGVLLRMLRGVTADRSDFAFAFSADAGGQLDRLDLDLVAGSAAIERSGDVVSFRTSNAEDQDEVLSFEHHPSACTWSDSGLLEVTGTMIGPGLQWFHPWPEGGGCYTATMKYASEGFFLGRPVRGFVGHEIHYMPEGRTWFNTRYGQGMEICWQQVANEYDDGTFEQGTFAYGCDGWGFAMVHEGSGGFVATTDVEIDATVRDNGYPEQIVYSFAGQEWIWRIDPHGERAATVAGAPLGADGTCVRADETRAVLRSLGNSDWWADGRYERSRSEGSDDAC